MKYYGQNTKLTPYLNSEQTRLTTAGRNTKIMTLATVWVPLVLILHQSIHISEAVDVVCESDRVKEGESVTCTCTSQSGNDIDWQKDGVSVSTCLASNGNCLPQPAIYEFSNDVSGSTNVFNITIKAFSYTDCAVFTCTDGTPGDATLSISAFNSDSQTYTVSEPLNNNGNITVTTSCLYKASDVTVTWYKVVEGRESPYSDEPSFNSTDSAACSDQCAGTSAETYTAWLYHEEVTSDFESGNLRVKLTHLSYSIPGTWTSSKTYQLKKGPTATTTIHPPSTTSNTNISSSTEKPSTTEKNTIIIVKDTSRKGIIIGASVGGTFVLIVIISTIVCCHLKKRNQEKKNQDKSDTRMRGGTDSVQSKTMSEAYENNAYKL